MPTVEDLEKAVAELQPRELARFRAWFDEFQALRFDDRIERDARQSKLDRIAAEAVAEHRRGDTSEL